jgi:uncharacterized ParB-like nuclease family protein
MVDAEGEVYDVPLSIINRPLVPNVNCNKVDSLMETL